MKLSPEEQKKQELYRDARITGKYDDIWQNVKQCPFCNLSSRYVIYEENDMVIGVPLFAYIDGHLLIIPRRHVEKTKDLTAKEWESVRKLMYIAKKIIKDVHHISGMQFIQKEGRDAQSTVSHIHFHCIPFDGPSLSTWNYRKLNNTPIENAYLYHQERKKIIKLADRFDKKYKDGND